MANNSNNMYDDYQWIIKDEGQSSLFKRTIVGNMPYCNQYVIICRDKYCNDIKNIMCMFRDINYKIAVSEKNSYSDDIINALRDIEEEELILLVPCNIMAGESTFNCNDITEYKEQIIKAEKEVLSGLPVQLLYRGIPTGIYCFKKKHLNKTSDNKLIYEQHISEIDISVEKQLNDENGLLETDTSLNKKNDFCVKLNPAFKDYLWGGVNLREKYGKQCNLDIIAESWELSAHEAGESVIADGRLKGMGFREYINKIGHDGLGWKCSETGDFPVLIKFIDAKNPLSIQVHPNDNYALIHEGEYGKNEMWYILDCEEGAGIYCGFKKDTSAEEVKERIENNTILDILNWIPVKKGDVYFIKAGTVHAIGGGIMICEIQQSSNCTYRLYDYDRKDKNGNKRELHIQKALDVLDYSKYEPQNNDDSYVETDNFSRKLLAKCKYFQCESCKIYGNMPLILTEASFKSVICVEGEGSIIYNNESKKFKLGDSLFLPGNDCTIEIEGNCEIVITEL